MTQEIGNALFERVYVLFCKLFPVKSAMHLERADRGDDNYRVGRESRHAAFYVKELLRAEVCAEARLGNGVVAHLERHPCRHDGVAAVGDIRKRAAVDKRGSALKGLDKVGLQSVLQKRGHRARRLELAAGHGLVVVGVADYNAREALLEVGYRVRKAEHCHNLTRNGYVKAVLAGHTVHLAAHAVNYETKLAVVHVNAAFPCYFANVYSELVALLNMIVEHGGKQVVRRAYRVKVTGEVEVDILHGNHLGISAAGGSALDSENRTEARLAQGNGDILAYSAQSVRKAYRRSSLALARGGGGYGGDENQLPVFSLCLREQSGVYLRLILSVLFHIFFIDMSALCNNAYMLGFAALRNFNVG